YHALFYNSDGIIKERKGKDIIQEKLVYLYDIKNGYYYEDTRISPFDVIIEAEKYETKSFYFKCTIEELDNKTCDDIIKERKERDDKLVSILKHDDEYLKKLALCADGFIVDRRSTGLKTIVAGYPWFSDWGRDTMIALQGMTLCTQRFDDARDILLSFAKYVNNGLLPNRFASNKDEETLYNTVDASMWYFYSVYKYLSYTGKKEDYDFVKENLYSVLKQIIEAYKNGTDFSIKMQDDYLISAGGGFDQVTWMDVRVGEWVVTPRHGKPVEINALWYNALKVMEELARYYKEDDTYYRDLAEKVKKSFVSKFWNEERQCLFDVVDENDDKIRPNQVWAVSLPFTMLDKEKEKKIINTVMQHLYTPYGLRTLSYEDKEFKSQYIGKLEDRDAAYHMGTAWPFLLGGFITAYCKTNDYSENAVKEAKDMLLVAFDHLNDGCINGYSEVFDGINPITGNGCYNQAWSVGELLRSYYEDVLLHTK
nr:glycogen debranching protein [Lachnospiraceae bacterium]